MTYQSPSPYNPSRRKRAGGLLWHWSDGCEYAKCGITSLLFIVVFTVLSLLGEESYRYMYVDDNYSIPAAYQKYNPELYPKDEHVRTTARIYITYYYDALYQLSRLADIKTACLIFHISTRLLFFASIFLLSISLFSRPEIGWINMLLFVLPKLAYGGTKTICRWLAPEYLAAPLLLIALACLFRKQIILFAIILSAIFYIHAMTAIWGLLLGFFFWLAIQGYKHIRQSLLALVLGAIIALPFFYQYFQSGLTGGELILTREQMESLARWRISPHVFPLSWGLMNNLVKLSAIGGAVVLGYLGVRRRPDLSRMLAWITLGTLLIWSAGFFFTEVHYLPVMNKMQLFRSSSIELILFSAFLANFVWVSLSEYFLRNNYLAIVVLLIGLLVFSFMGVGICQLLGVLIMGLSSFVAHQKVNAIIGMIVVKLPRKYWNHLWNRKWLAATVSAMMSLVTIYTLGHGMIRYCQKASSISEPLKEAALWARGNTLLDALFATPPAIQGFRYWAQRSQLPDWTDGGLGNYDARFGAYFLRVMNAYGLHPGMDERYLDQVSGQQIITVGRQFGADYALLPNAEPELPAMTVFTNNQWRIVRLN